jgi:hypothetical protein
VFGQNNDRLNNTQLLLRLVTEKKDQIYLITQDEKVDFDALATLMTCCSSSGMGNISTQAVDMTAAIEAADASELVYHDRKYAHIQSSGRWGEDEISRNIDVPITIVKSYDNTLGKY